MTRTIDVHNHLYSKEWLDYLKTRDTSPRLEMDGTNMVLYSHGRTCAHIYTPGHYDPKERLKDLDRCGIDTQVISHTLPSVEELPVEEGVKWARKINDYFAEVCQQFPGRYHANATLPLQDPDEAVRELKRAHKELHLRGVCMFSNVNYRPIASEEFHPVYQKASEYGLPIFIHPGAPFTGDIMREHKIRPSLYGFTLDTTMAVVSLIWQGILEKYPGLKLVHGHLGGMVPYLAQRMEDVWRTAHRELGLDLPMTPSEYYQRQVYPDTMSAHLPAMRCCLEYVGAGRMVMGTDYAHRIGNWEEAVFFIKQLNLSKEDTDRILGGNAAQIYSID
jgi:aminocarboxymuconate-semialdehyde decarboxylase